LINVLITMSLKQEFKSIRSTRKELKSFGLTVGVALLVLGAWFIYRKYAVGKYFLGVGAVLLVCGFIVPRVLYFVQRAWMMFGLVMGWFVTRLILVVAYYGVITPLSIFAYLFGKKFLDLRWRANVQSYWVSRVQKLPHAQAYENQF